MPHAIADEDPPDETRLARYWREQMDSEIQRRPTEVEELWALLRHRATDDRRSFTAMRRVFGQAFSSFTFNNQEYEELAWSRVQSVYDLISLLPAIDDWSEHSITLLKFTFLEARNTENLIQASICVVSTMTTVVWKECETKGPGYVNSDSSAIGAWMSDNAHLWTPYHDALWHPWGIPTERRDTINTITPD